MTKTSRTEKILNFILFSLAFVSLSLFIRPRKSREKIIGFASSHFAGNIKYLYLEMSSYPNVKLFFVSGEKDEIRKVKKRGFDARYYLDLKSIPLFLRTHVWVTSHGSNYIPFIGLARRILPFLKWKHGSKWVDVWHGLGFKHAGREKMLVNYDLAFVPSEFFRQYYSKKANISSILRITGEARTDPFIKNIWDREEILKELHIPIRRKNILYAPTYHHGKKESFLPWGSLDENLKNIEHFCKENNSNFLVRLHPSWSWVGSKEKEKFEEKISQSNYIFNISVKRYPDVQRVLYITDVLITDWSSIANDFILLNRPIIFLDIPLPVEEFVLTPEDRVGYVVRNKQEFFEKLQEALDDPKLFEEKRRVLLKKLYKHLDGNSAKRCAEEILKLLRE